MIDCMRRLRVYTGSVVKNRPEYCTSLRHGERRDESEGILTVQTSRITSHFNRW